MRRRRIDRKMRECRERRYRLRNNTSRFIPDADRDFARMAKQFAEYIAKHAERFPLKREQIEKVASAVSAYRSALARAQAAIKIVMPIRPAPK